MFAAHMYVYTRKYVCTVPNRRKKKKLPQHEIASHETKLSVKMTLEGKGKRNRNRIEMAELQIATNASFFLSISHSLRLSPSLDSSHPKKIMRILFCFTLFPWNAVDIKERTVRVIQKAPIRRRLQSNFWAIKRLIAALSFMFVFYTAFPPFSLCFFFKNFFFLSFFNLFKYRLSFSSTLFSPFLWLQPTILAW